MVPLTGGYDIGKQPEWNLTFVTDAVHHSVLPALSIILAQMGTWALGMRGMMVMTEGEDYMTYAKRAASVHAPFSCGMPCETRFSASHLIGALTGHDRLAGRIG